MNINLFSKTNRPKKEKKPNKFIEEKFVPFLGKVGAQRHLCSIRDGFATIMPLIIAGALSILVMTAVFGGMDSEKTSLLGIIAKWAGGIHVNDKWDVLINKDSFFGQWKFQGNWGAVSEALSMPFNLIFEATTSLIGLWFTFALGYFLSKSRGFDNPFSAAFVALAAFMIATQADKAFFGSAGSIIGIFIGIAATELYVFLAKFKKLKITMPAGVPPAVARSFNKLIPIIFTLILIATADTIFIWLPAWLMNWGYVADAIGAFGNEPDATSGIHFGQILYYAVIAPFLGFASDDNAGLGIGLLYVFLIGFIWWFGLHGDYVLDGIFGTIMLILIQQNTEHIAGIKAGTYEPNLINNSTNYAFVVFGGAGSTICLIIPTLWFGKDQGQRELCKYASPAAAFHVNEPIIFGIPIILNPIFWIPFVFILPTLLLIAWIVMKIHWVTVPYLQVPWTAPPLIAALLATGFDWRAVILALFNMIVGCLIYLPFVLFNNIQIKNKK